MAPIAGFPDEVHVQPFLSAEWAALAADLAIRDVLWHGVFASARAPDAIGRGVARLRHAGHASAALDAADANLIDIARLDLAGQASCYPLVDAAPAPGVASVAQELDWDTLHASAMQVGGFT